MRLYLEAKSKNKIGYTPDWLKVSFYEDGELLELTLDIQGEIDYDENCLSCRCKGVLIPWVLYNCESGDETDLYSLTDEQVKDIFPDDRIAKIICESENYEIGIFPVTNGDRNDVEVFKMAKDDIISNEKGSFEMFVDEHCYNKEFEFEAEINID